VTTHTLLICLELDWRLVRKRNGSFHPHYQPHTVPSEFTELVQFKPLRCMLETPCLHAWHMLAAFNKGSEGLASRVQPKRFGRLTWKFVTGLIEGSPLLKRSHKA